MTRDLTPSRDQPRAGNDRRAPRDERTPVAPGGHRRRRPTEMEFEEAQTDPARTLWPLVAGRMGPGVQLSDRYRVIELLASGGMSRLYLAEQVGLERRVVLKTIFREFVDDARSLRGFLQEARVLARVNHPNIVSVYGVGETTAGERYIAMEFVPGESLAALLQREGRLPLGRTVSILLQLARALAAVHREGVIHRDIKPGNVLLVRKRSGIELAKLSDFGLAKITKHPSRADTGQGIVLGTPHYMPPEQIRARTIDHRADLYSLGCVAYEMLTGRPPFAGSRLAALNGHLHDQPKPLARACPEASIPPCFQQFIDGALAKDPKQRFGSAFELYASLLATSDCAGIPRRELRLVETLFDDPAYALVHEGSRRRMFGSMQLPRATLETWLRWIVLAICAFTAGVAVGQLSRGSGQSAARIASAADRATRIVVTEPAGEYASIDGSEWREIPTAFNRLLAGRYELRLGRPGEVRAIVPVDLSRGETRVVSGTPAAPPPP